MNTMLEILGILVVAVGAAMWRGFVLSILWTWFLVPLGVHPIGVAWAIGLSTLVLLLAPKAVDGGDRKGLDPEDIAKVVAIPLFALGIGWIAHQFM